jgi:hypothetical protein
MSMSNDESTRDAELSRAYRQGAKGEPPAALDALILAAARQEAATPVRGVRIPWWRRALVPVGVFATLVVTVSVVLMIEQEQRDQLPAPAPAVPAAVSPEAASPKADESAKAAAPKQEEHQRAVAKPRAAPAMAPQSAPLPPESVPAASSDSELRENVAEPVPAARGAVMSEQKALSGERPAPAAAAAASPAAAARRDLRAADKLEAARAPAEWLEAIRRLLRAGRETEAQAQLAAFRRAYPGYALPDDLKRP